MIKIYTDMDKLSSTKIVKDPESYFKAYVSSKSFDKHDMQVIKEMINHIAPSYKLGAFLFTRTKSYKMILIAQAKIVTKIRLLHNMYYETEASKGGGVS